MTIANGIDTTATGLGAQAGTPNTPATGATAYGAYASAQGENTTAIGYRAVAKLAGSVAIGHNAQALGDPTTAIGENALASGDNAVALGANTKATANNSVALGTGSVADQPNTVSIGSPGSERRITNVAPGINPTDAVNLSQLRDVSRIAYSGVAMSMAMSGVYVPPLEPGEYGAGIGLGNYKGYSSLAFQIKGLNRMGDMGWNLGVSTTGKEWGVQLGIGMKWK
jgi:autotransporter adhesin